MYVCIHIYMRVYIYIYVFVYLFLVALGLCWCTWAFSSCRDLGLLVVVSLDVDRAQAPGTWASVVAACGLSGLT